MDFSADIAAELDEDLRYRDPQNAACGNNPAEIHQQAIDSLSRIIQGYMDDKNRLATWFGKYMTQIKDDDFDCASASPLVNGSAYRLEPHCRSAYS